MSPNPATGSGQAPAQAIRVLPLSLIVPENVRDVEVVQVIARWRSLGGLQLGNRPVPFQLGLPLDLVARLFIEALNAGVVQERVVIDGQEVTRPVRAIHFVTVAEPPASRPPPPGGILRP